MRVLIVEDEKRLAATLQDLMEMNGFTADVCYDGVSGLDNALSGIYDVMILDVMLPKKDGFTVLRELRKAGGTVPVLMLTARSELMDKVTGLDYYLTKPCEPRELIACVRALSRRTPEIREDENLTCGDLRLELTALTLWRGEESVRLSRKECDLRELLIRNRKIVLSKESILVKIWGYESEAEDNNVEVYISFLRRKLARLHSTVKIRTIRMASYCLEEA